MKFFIVEKNGDLNTYHSQADAESSMEYLDIKVGEYVKAYDELGNEYEIGSKIHRQKTKLLGLIPFTYRSVYGELRSTGENKIEELKGLLQRHHHSINT